VRPFPSIPMIAAGAELEKEVKTTVEAIAQVHIDAK
jgi:hypothetical protein